MKKADRVQQLGSGVQESRPWAARAGGVGEIPASAPEMRASALPVIPLL